MLHYFSSYCENILWAAVLKHFFFLQPYSSYKFESNKIMYEAYPVHLLVTPLGLRKENGVPTVHLKVEEPPLGPSTHDSN